MWELASSVVSVFRVSEVTFLTSVIGQATNEGFQSLTDLFFLDDVSQFSVVKN